jgi:membrane protein implicated in regulation of membrane protease activity
MMETPLAASRPRRINWLNLMTVMSAAILIGAEVFGAAFAGGWALAGLFNLGTYGGYTLQLIFFAIGLAVMARFIRAASRVEPFTSG